MHDGLIRAGAGASSAPTVGELFTPQEEAALRHYSETRSRYEAMVAAGYVSQPHTLQDHADLVAQMGRLLARAEQMSLSQIASAIGGDKVAYISVLWQWCQCDKGHDAIKALMLMGRVHGIYDKAGQHNTQVALIFNAATTPAASQAPADLPFTLPSGDYRVYPPADNEKEGAK